MRYVGPFLLWLVSAAVLAALLIVVIDRLPIEQRLAEFIGLALFLGISPQLWQYFLKRK